MGIIGRAMPLLSTLAALVILVHSAEEDMERGLERDYRHDNRARILDTRPSPYDESWRADDVEPPLQQTTRMNVWDESPETPRRRRPVRKRRRRPMQPSQEDAISDEKHLSIHAEFPETLLYPEQTDNTQVEYHYHGEGETTNYRTTLDNYQPTTQMPKRKRKRPENRPLRWNEDEIGSERPLRRRGLRRRPVTLRPRLVEFPDVLESEEPERYHIEEDIKRGNDYFVPKEDMNPPKDEITFQDIHDEYQTSPISSPPPPSVQELEMFKFNEPEEAPKKQEVMELKEDKSLSEFSVEDEPARDEKREYQMNKARSKISTHTYAQNQDNRPIDPLTLKELLKRSSGTSLSEVLQQHNLSLSDLLGGKQDAISALKVEESIAIDNDEPNDDKKENKLTTKTNQEIEQPRPETTTVKQSDLESQSTGGDTKTQSRRNTEIHDATARNTTRRRFPNMRRKLRMRTQPVNGYKSPLSRDLMAQTARKYQNTRNITKSKEWRYVIPMMNNNNSSEELDQDYESTMAPTTTTTIPEETTILHNSEYYSPSTVKMDIETAVNEKDYDEEEIRTTTQIVTTPPTTTTTELTTTTQKSPRIRPPASRMGLRRQAYNNRLKRKRMKQKNSTTVPPQNENGLSMEIFGMPNLVSSSEFIARTQTPKPVQSNQSDEDFTSLDDFMTTENSNHVENGQRFTRNSTIPGIENEPISPSTVLRYPSTTEETAKFEIEEILNDTRTSAKLSRILMERNMTLNELVEHRERGSSHVHLADIFHNASKEPNPPEPFLSKSLIEPISRETYPLRAILEANSHDTGSKATTGEPNIAQSNSVNIPVVMDFGNNVNENGENMGIISLFNKIVGNDINDVENSSTGKDSEGTPYVTTIIAVNNTDVDNTAREDKALNVDNNLRNDVVGWAELFDLMRRSRQNETEGQELQESSNSKPSNQVLIEDADGNGVIVLGDLQKLKELNINTETEEEIHVNLHDRSHKHDTSTPGILDRLPSHTRSVTVATASIVGLAIILFLLTYAAFKWKQQRSMLRKKQSFSDDRIPTPVFESRKSHKNNCSTRSISPMLNTSNIYTMNTLDSSNGKESPDYMWDSLRKPFQ